MPPSANGSTAELVKKILLFEDDEGITDLIREIFRQEKNFRLIDYDDSDRPLEKIRHHKPDLLILDLNLPSVSGWDVIKMIRQEKTLPYLPVIMITACYKTPQDIVSGLEHFQADDYILKPFSPVVFLARVKALLRRQEMQSVAIKKSGIATAPAAGREIKVNGIRINPDNFEVYANGEKIQLSPTQFKILLLLVKRAGNICTRDEISSLVVTNTDEDADFLRTIDKHISDLRRKLGKHGDKIKSVYGLGYIFETKITS